MSEPNDQQPSPITEESSGVLIKGTNTLQAAETTALSAAGSIAVPIPPRYWWLKRLLIGSGVLLVALFILRTWWGWEAQHRLDAQIAVYVARGEPIYPEDFDTEPIPDDQNAAWYLKEAAAAISLTYDQESNVGLWCRDLELAAEHLDEIRRIVDANASALRLLRKARNAPSTDWGLRFRSPLVNAVLPRVTPQRVLARLLKLSVLMQHENGDDDGAVELLLEIAAHAKTVDHFPTAIGHLVAIGIDGQGINAIEIVAPRLLIAGLSGSSTPPALPAKRQQLRSLIEELSNDSAYALSAERASIVERAFQLDMSQVILAGQAIPTAWGFAAPFMQPSLLERAQTYALIPLLQIDTCATLQYATARGEGLARTDWGAMRTVHPPIPETQTLFYEIQHPISRVFLPSDDRVSTLHFRALAHRRMAATALAIRLYETDHGKRPEMLTQLVPEYMRELLADPFASDGRAFGYLPNARLPILYSINQDGENDGGDFTFRRSGHRIDGDRLDLPFFLNGDRPKNAEHLQELMRNSHQANEDHNHVDDDSG